jgi:hypothetical protein
VVAKYWDQPYGTLMDCAMSDYPMISMVFFSLHSLLRLIRLKFPENWLMLHTPNDTGPVSLSYANAPLV